MENDKSVASELILVHLKERCLTYLETSTFPLHIPQAVDQSMHGWVGGNLTSVVNIGVGNLTLSARVTGVGFEQVTLRSW